MLAITERFEVYIKKHVEYNKVIGKVEQIHNSNASLEKELHNKQNELLNTTKQKSRIESEKMDLEKELENQRQLYVECTESNSSLKSFFSKNEFTDPVVFQKKQDEIRNRYEKSLQEYYLKRKDTLEDKKEHIVKEELIFNQNSRDFAKAAMEKIYPGCGNIIDKKKQDILEYLNANETIQNSDITRSIVDVIENSKLSYDIPSQSEEKLIQDIIELKGTEGYARTKKFDVSEFKMQRQNALDFGEIFRQFNDGHSKYQSDVFVPFLGISAIILLIVFMMGYTPMNLIIPASTTIAGVSQGIVQMVVRIIVSCFGAAVVGGVAYFVLKLVGLDKAATIGASLIGLYMFWMMFTGSYPKITTQNMMGFGKVIHLIIAFVLNLILVAVIIVILYNIILNTPVAKLFFQVSDDVILRDLNAFSEYFFANKELYHVMFHLDEVFICICKERFKLQIKKVENDLRGIREENAYLQLKDECNIELARRVKARKKQLSEIEKRKNELEEMLKKKKYQSETLQGNLSSLKIAISNMTMQLERDKRLEETLINQTASDKKFLLEETEFIMDKNDSDFEEKCLRINTSEELLNCNGKLSKQLFFVRKVKDKYGMAEVKKIDFKCMHTVFIYDNEELEGNNLSEELCHFIKWFAEAVRRINPATLLSRYFTVIDVLSGQSVLTMPPYDKYINVIGDEKGKLTLAEMLGSKMDSVTAEMNHSDLVNEGEHIDNIDILNEKKMIINKPDIEQQHNISIQDLWEKLIPYHILIFIVPAVIENGAQPSILNEDLKKALINADHYGIIPIFIISKETWENSKVSSDAAYLKNIQNKFVRTIYNVGKSKGNLLDI